MESWKSPPRLLTTSQNVTYERRGVGTLHDVALCTSIYLSFSVCVSKSDKKRLIEGLLSSPVHLIKTNSCTLFKKNYNNHCPVVCAFFWNVSQDNYSLPGKFPSCITEHNKNICVFFSYWTKICLSYTVNEWMNERSQRKQERNEEKKDRKNEWMKHSKHS